MKILVTGINGFVGRHLARALNEAGIEVDGVIKTKKSASSSVPFVKKIIVCDLMDPSMVHKINFSPYAAIVHLAALANVGESFANPELYMEANTKPLINICESLIIQHVSPRIVAVSTGAVYDSNQPMPLTENSKLTTNASPYALSKLAMEKIAVGYADKGLDCVIARPFNHIGPGQGSGYLIPDLKHKILDAQKNDMILQVGNLLTRRDYTDVRDVVDAYLLIATAKKDQLSSRIYNICSQKSHSGKEILDQLKKNIPGSKGIKIVVDESLIRPSDPKDLKGSYALLKSDTSWAPKISLQKTLKDITQQD